MSDRGLAMTRTSGDYFLKSRRVGLLESLTYLLFPAVLKSKLNICIVGLDTLKTPAKAKLNKKKKKGFHTISQITLTVFPGTTYHRAI